MANETNSMKHWKELAYTITATATMLNKFGWSQDVTAEYVRHLKRLGCSPETALARFTELFERTGELPGFKEVAELSLSYDLEERFAYGPNGEHIDALPVKILLLKKDEKNPHEPPRYAICRCGCGDCRPMKPPTLRSKPLEIPKGKWQERADELASLGRSGFFQLMDEMKRAGVPIARKIGSITPNHESGPGN